MVSVRLVVLDGIPGGIDVNPLLVQSTFTSVSLLILDTSHCRLLGYHSVSEHTDGQKRRRKAILRMMILPAI